MDNLNQTHTAPGPGVGPMYTDPAQPAGPAPSAVSHSTVRSGRGRFLGFLAAAVLAVGTGVAGFAAAGGSIGGADTEVTATPGDAGEQVPAEAGDGGSEAPTTDGGSEAPTTGEDGADRSGGATDSQATPGEEPTPVPGTAMTVQEANASVIRIEATGEFVDPEFGPLEGVGSGSGFIIDGSGIAVTNNHVVAGAAFLEVFVPGEDQPRNARILATSECSDLAVIDIDGNGFQAVSLGVLTPEIGTDVYAAGYPLGDPEFTLTKGIVSRADTRGDTHLSSVDGVLEHDARINPGNSGGPLFDHTGQVVGINYQGNPSTRQSFAITAARALPIVEQLRAGTSVDSIGINGQIVDLGDRYGLFISSVETGSMADQVGLLPGDIILELENVAVSTDGTMGDYCDVLRTNGTDVPLDLTVLRPSTDQLLFGTINGGLGGGPLAVTFDAGDMMGQGAMGATGGYDQATMSMGFQRVADDGDVVSVEVPTDWTDVSTSPLGTRSDLPNVSASTDLTSFENDWVVGGVQLTAFDGAAYGFDDIWSARNDLLDNCDEVEDGREVDFGTDTGLIRIGHGCGPDATASLVLFQVPGESGYFASGIIQVVDEADVAAAERILATFEVR